MYEHIQATTIGITCGRTLTITEVMGEGNTGRKKKYATASGLPLAAWLPASGPDGPLESPGEWPFTRGIHEEMYRKRLWTMRQYAGFSSAKETNERFRYLLEQGQTGLSVAFDLPTQIGYDADHPLAVAESGQVGVAINSLRDFETLFDGIPLKEVSVSMTINATALVLYSMLIAVAKKQGVDAEQIRGTIQNDILKEFVARGNFRFDAPSSMRLTTDLLQFAQETAPRFNPISVSGYHMREAGCTAVQEVAYTLGDGIAYLEAANKAGLDPSVTASRMSFFFNGHNDFFEEVSKFRASRRLWARIVRERFGVSDPRAQRLRFHTQTGGSTLSSAQPLVNAARVTVQGMAAVLGGTQSLHTNSFDEALGLPSEEAALLALRTQQVIGYESGVADVVDPLGGAPFIEDLTSKIEQEAADEIDFVDREFGGMVGAVEAGHVQRAIHEVAVRHQKEIESGERVQVGVNRFQVSEAAAYSAFKPNPEGKQQVLDALFSVRAERDDAAVQTALHGLRKSAGTNTPLGPSVLTAVESYATVGEICEVLADIFPPYKASSLF